MSGYETLKLEDRGPIRIVTIDRPAVLNAIDATVIRELTAVVEQLGHDTSVRGVLLTGSGEKAFVAGADIALMCDMDSERALAFSGSGHALGEMIADLAVPVLAAVNGFALGGGCELALACDFIYASDNAKFGQPEVRLGVIPGFGGTQRLARRIGLARALELCCSGQIIGADEALRIGLVNRVVPRAELQAVAVATLETIAQMAPLAIAKVKQVLHRGSELPLGEANLLEQRGFAELFATADQQEGMAAFLAKRAATFRGE
ncbi:MAG: enoyl-CoA hydratase/isomerase family protein [Deltaproteobacteria bacterium]|nr:enoyl-CoA hydratase/isomerase family protein [Nannocystaceae bacterium]